MGTEPISSASRRRRRMLVHGAPPALPTRRTLVFPAVEVPRGRVVQGSHSRVERPSERPTAPTLPPAFDSSQTDVVELSASALESLPERLSEARDLGEVNEARVGRTAPRWLVPVVLGRRILAWGAFALLATLAFGGDATPVGPRTPNVAGASRRALVYARTEAVVAPPSGGCATAGPARLVAERARLAPGVDVSVLEGGFGLGYASAVAEASAVVVEGPLLRVADRVHVRGAGEITRVGIDATSEDLGVRTDGAIVAGGSTVRIVALGGIVHAVADGQAPRVLWRSPGPSAPPARVPEVLRAASRDDGSAVVVLKRPGALWVGALDATLAPTGPLVSIPRPSVTLGTPSVAAANTPVVAWAERAPGAPTFAIHVASIAPDDGDHVTVHERLVAPGMSPSLTPLPDGDLLLAWTSGTSGAHRVLVQRLAPDLEARGEPMAVSPADLNAGQPAAAVRADGRGVVAFFAAGARRTGDGSLLAAPLACDPGL